MGAGIEEPPCSPSTSSPSPSAVSSSSASGHRSPSGSSTRKPQLSDTDSAHSVICPAECSIEDNEKTKGAVTPPPLQSRQTAAAVAVLAGYSAVYLTYSQRHPLLFYLMTILIVTIVTSLYSFGFCAVLYMVRRDYYEEEEREESDYGEDARRRREEREVVDPAPSPSTTTTCLTGMPETSCLRIPINAHALKSAEAVQRL